MEKSLVNLLKNIGYSDVNTLRRVDIAFDLYAESLNKWNRVFNLVSRVSPPLDHHFFDSLQYLKVVPKNGRFLDIGSGAGFPGVPLKIVMSNIQMQLIESRRKKVSFLRNLITTLEIKNIGVIHNRAEHLHQDWNYEKQFDVVLFRGFGKPEDCLSLGEKFLKSGGILVLKQGVEVLCPRKFNAMELEKEVLVKNLNNIFSKIVVFKQCST